MLALIEITLNVISLGALLLVTLFIGFIARNMQLAKLRKCIENLENEMLQSHAEILKLQKENSNLEIRQQSQTPIVSIRDNATESGKQNQKDPKTGKTLFPPVRKTNP